LLASNNPKGNTHRYLRKDLFDLFAELTEFAILIIDPLGYITDCNVGAENLYGANRNDLVGVHLAKFFSEEELVNGQPWENLRLAKEYRKLEFDFWGCKLNGTKFCGNTLMVAIHNADASLQYFVTITRDTTAEKKGWARQALQRAVNELKRKDAIS
jgi:PAS domain S-box-containing protein